MAQHNSSLHHSQQSQSQQQQQQQQQQAQSQQQTPVTVVNQQQLVGASVQLQTQQQNIQANAASQQNNNYPGSQQHGHYAQVHPGGVFMPSHAAPAMYHMIPPPLPGNVYVNNVTANVNLHGYSVPQYVPPYIANEVPQGVQHGVEQTGQIMQPVTVSTSTRGSRRGRGRGGNSNNRRNDYVQRQQASPAPQEMINPAIDPQTMAPTGYQQFYHYYPQPIFTAPPQTMGHPQAQSATGPPLYLAGPVPMYGHQVYNYPGFVYNMIPPDYQMMDEKAVEEQPPPEGMMTQLWHPHMAGIEYPEEYMNPELIDDMNNHNASPMSSSNTPSMMSPIMYDQSIELQQQMGTMHLYEASSLSQQSLQSDEPIQENVGHLHHHHHHQMHEQMPPMMHEQMINVEQLQADEMQMINEQQQGEQDDVNEISVPSTVTPTAIVVHSHETVGIIHPHFVNNNQDVEQNVNNNNINNNQIVTAASTIADNNYVVDSNQNVPNVSSLRPEDKPTIIIPNSHVVPNVQPMIAPLQQQQQQQQQPQQQQFQKIPVDIQNVPSVDNSPAVISSNVNKTMQWTNHTKKNTTSVAITATPGLAAKTASNSKTLNVNGIQFQPQQQQQPQTVQMKNHGVMKTPSSPVAASNEISFEKKALQTQTSFEMPKNIVSTTSTASAVVPQQLQQEQYKSVVPVSSSPLQNQISVESKRPPASQQHQQQQQQQQHSYQQYNNSNSAHSLSTATGTNAELSTVATKQRKDDGSVIVLPTPTLQPQQSQPGTSWASLFTSNAPAPGSTPPAAPQPIQIGHSIIHTKKPIAKVLPFEGTSNIAPAVPPGGLSYSAASAQGLTSSSEHVAGPNSSGTIKPMKSSSQTNIQQLMDTNNTSNTASLSKGNAHDDWSMKFADFLTKYKIDFSSVSLRPRGLTNCSNYCYINAILQSLVGCPPFYNLIKSIPKLPISMLQEKNLKAISAMTQLVSEFSNLPPGARLTTNRREKTGKKGDELAGELTCDPAFTPHAIYKLWNDSRSDVVEGRQEDAEEFLGFVLNQINDEMLEVIKLIAKPAMQQNGEQNTEGDDGEDWQMIYNNRNKGSVTRQTDFGRTPLSDIFRGELRSRLQREGEHSTDDIQPFFTLQLNIEKAASVKEALEILVGRDQLEGVTCSKTNQEVNAWQQMTLEKLPVVLILHLKWFDYKPDGCTKILKTVEFPVELKIDTKILASKKYSQKQRLYRLFAVVYHDGKEASKGHYITDVFHIGYNNWLRFDDSSVKPVSEQSVLRPRAPRVPYLLCYRRADTVQPSQQQQQQHQQQQQQQQPTTMQQQQQQQQQQHQPQHHQQHTTNK